MRTAVELKVDLCTVKGTGPHGAITRADVERAAAAPAAPAPPSEKAPALAAAPAVEAPKAAPQRKPSVAPEERRATMRKVIGAAMSRSKREIPHYYLGAHIDMSRSLSWLQGENLKRPVSERILYSVFSLKPSPWQCMGSPR